MFTTYQSMNIQKTRRFARLQTQLIPPPNANFIFAFPQASEKKRYPMMVPSPDLLHQLRMLTAIFRPTPV
jgi:hypothetical protein